MSHRRLSAVAIASVMLFAACGDDVAERRSTIYALGQGDDPQGEVRIREFLTDSDPDVRATALNALVLRRTEDAAQIAEDALGDEHGFVRSMAAKLLGDLGSDRAVGALGERTLSDPEPIVRQRSAEALARIGSPKALDDLRVGLSDPDREVRLAVVKAVGALDPNAALPELARLLIDDSVWQIRVEAARVLGDSGDGEMRAVLERAGNDANEFVRTAAAHALERLGDAPVEADPS